MDTSLLSPLQSRWPNDRQPSATDMNIQNIEQAIGQLSGSSSPWVRLQIDPSDSKIIADFAQANNMTYVARPDDIVYSPKPRPAWVGPLIPATAPAYVHRVRGSLQGYEISFFLEYAASPVQTRGSDYVALRKRSIVKVRLPKIFPQVVLDSHKNEPGYISSFPTTIKSDQKITLEGDFGTFFDFYAPHNLQVNTLTLLAPNFMQILMNSASTFDVEFFGDEMTLATWENIYDPAVIQVAFDALSEQLAYIDRLVASWNYEPLKPPFDTLKYTYFSGETIKVGKLHISPFGLLVIILLMIVLFGITNVLTK